MRGPITLGDCDAVQIRTADGIVHVSTFFGTIVAVYDDPDGSPVSTTTVRPKQKEN